jgi:phytoene dehydrogenase-like protein
MSARPPDAIVVGSGPNGLAAAITIALAGLRVLVVEAAPTIGGGARSAELTLPGFLHDVCSAIHPLARGSPFFSRLALERHGLAFVDPPLALAHPLDDGSAAVLERSIDRTADSLGAHDGARWKALVGPLVARFHDLVGDALTLPRLPTHPLLLARFGLRALAPAAWLARRTFRDEPARAMFAGLAAHSMLPLSAPVTTSAIALILGAAAHAVGWPIARGGSQAISDALAGCARSLGGRIETSRRVTSLAELPAARAVLLDLSPRGVLEVASSELPSGYRDALAAYRYGMGSFKIDWALDGPIPWRAEACRRAGTVHVGGTLEEIAASERATADGRIAERPFVLVAQQSLFDPTRAPAGRHTGWAYCHVPNGSTEDMTARIEAQIERFAPGFRDRILERRTSSPAALERYDANYVGGDVNGGAQDALQMLARPVLSLRPWATPNPRIFVCSASTPPGGGVHGMCGHSAARTALARVLARS